MDPFKNKIAVIGIACRFPGAKDLDNYWKNLISGIDTIKHFTVEELLNSEYEHFRNNPEYVRARGMLGDIDKFDADFFGLTPREAAVTDPQHRVWLETAWEAFEDAGCNPIDYPGTVSVFAGGNMSSYLSNSFLRDWDGSADATQMWLGNDTSFIPTKTAFYFNLRGPAINVQTACSTSLVAIIQACQSLYSYESDICLAGGITISVPQDKGYIFQEGGIHSPDGYCRTFDAQANGTVFSNGVGAVILKRLEDAIRDHDTIYAVVSGWATNNDGSKKMSYTAPSVDGQAEVIQMAQSFAEVSPEEISYIEAHGTATLIGDPIEIAALTKVFRATTDRKQFCGIGSVKSNIGHTDSAAGVASFIKVCLSAYNRKIPPSLHYTNPNPHIDFENSPFYVLSKVKEWTEERPLIMGVSSFGIGGTNAHVIVEEPPAPEATGDSETSWPDLLVLSAKSDYSLNRRKMDLVEYLKGRTYLNIHDVAGTLALGRKHMNKRSFVVASDLEEIISGEKPFTDGEIDSKVSKIAFMFPGQGAQYLKMGWDLYQKNNTFREILDECFGIYKSETGQDLKAILFESNGSSEAEQRLASTDVTQPALFIIEYALSKVLQEIDIKPDYLIGHSIGEYVAACIAGVFDLRTALKITIKRGQLMSKMPQGSMMAVRSGIERLRAISDTYFEVAGDNAPESCTISFRSENTDKVKTLLEKHGIQYITLNTSHAFHSADFDPILSEFNRYVNQFSLKPPQLSFISCLTGTFITREQATSGEYWAKQLRNTVLFRQGISVLADKGSTVFLEVGPNTHLGSLARQSAEITNKNLIISTLGKSDTVDERYKVLTALGNLNNVGININFEVSGAIKKSKRIKLPVYPFQRNSHWIDFNRSDIPGTTSTLIQNSLLKLNNDIDTGTDNVKISTGTETGVVLHSDSYSEKIAGIWNLVIGRKEIEFDDNFFEIGGHSLLALQVLTRIKEVLGFNISLKNFMDNPTINKLSALINSLTENAEETINLIHLTGTTHLPLTRNQKRLWLLSRLQPEIPSYIIPLTYKFSGPLNNELFEKSLKILFQRHYIVFSVIKEINGEPFFEIIPSEAVINYSDYSGRPEAEKKELLNETIRSTSGIPFDMIRGPLYRLFLIKTAAEEFYFHLSIHHIIFDGISIGVFVNDLAAIYNSLSSGKEVALEKLEIQQYDYAKWENTRADKEDSVSFWEEYLKDCSQVINFPLDFPRKVISSGKGSAEEISLTKTISEKLRQIARNEGTSLFATVMSIFGVILHKYSGEDDINIGLPVAYRPHTKLEKIFGMFVNTVVVRLKYDKGMTFKDLIRQTGDSAMRAIAHQDLPFDRIVEIVKPDRLSNANPLFQTCFIWQNNLNMPLNINGVSAKRIFEKKRTIPFDLSLYLWENGEIIEGEIEYDTELFKYETILKFRESFLNLINKLIENSDVQVDYISLINEEEKRKITHFNDTFTPYPKNKTIIQLFEDQVNKFGDKVAVVFKGKSLSYTRLNQSANQLARTLREAGVTRNTPVGLLAEKSPDVIIGLLGILKAGGAYVPIDPDYPEERINFIVNDSGCKVLLIQNKFSGLNIKGVLKTDLNSSHSFSPEKSDPESINVSSDLAYIMYTSGTTGKPKGSLIRQYSVIRLVRNTNYLNITPEDRILLTSAIVFDVATFEIWGALLNGAELHIAEKETILNPKALGKELSDNRITVLWLTSALLTQIAEARTDIFRNLNYLLAGGDVLSAPHINKIRRDIPGIKIINGYGPTENTTFSTTYLIEKDFETNIPIGKPISNSTAYIFDRYMNYQPVGVIGELYVGGDGVSAGYLNRDDLNAKSFVDHPDIPGERLYKTGDYARWLPDGNIEFHGRIDNQLKIRGFRVELGEIESVISELAGVVETVVKPLKTTEGDYMLVAFLSVAESFKMDPAEIGKYIRTKLPPYMVPSAYKFMNGFPRNINGKIDKKVLVYEVAERESRNKEELKPLTSAEKIIYEIWCEALKTKDISTTDNFFDIGGNSLMAISVFSKIETAFDIELGLRMFFDSPRIKDLAEILDAKLNISDESMPGIQNLTGKSKTIEGEI